MPRVHSPANDLAGSIDATESQVRHVTTHSVGVKMTEDEINKLGIVSASFFIPDCRVLDRGVVPCGTVANVYSRSF